VNAVGAGIATLGKSFVNLFGAKEKASGTSAPTASSSPTTSKKPAMSEGIGETLRNAGTTIVVGFEAVGAAIGRFWKKMFKTKKDNRRDTQAILDDFRKKDEERQEDDEMFAEWGAQLRDEHGNIISPKRERNSSRLSLGTAISNASSSSSSSAATDTSSSSSSSSTTASSSSMPPATTTTGAASGASSGSFAAATEDLTAASSVAPPSNLALRLWGAAANGFMGMMRAASASNSVSQAELGSAAVNGVIQGKNNIELDEITNETAQKIMTLGARKDEEEVKKNPNVAQAASKYTALKYQILAFEGQEPTSFKPIKAELARIENMPFDDTTNTITIIPILDVQGSSLVQAFAEMQVQNKITEMISILNAIQSSSRLSTLESDRLKMLIKTNIQSPTQGSVEDLYLNVIIPVVSTLLRIAENIADGNRISIDYLKQVKNIVPGLFHENFNAAAPQIINAYENSTISSLPEPKSLPLTSENIETEITVTPIPASQPTKRVEQQTLHATGNYADTVKKYLSMLQMCEEMLNIFEEIGTREPGIAVKTSKTTERLSTLCGDYTTSNLLAKPREKVVYRQANTAVQINNLYQSPNNPPSHEQAKALRDTYVVLCNCVRKLEQANPPVNCADLKLELQKLESLSPMTKDNVLTTLQRAVNKLKIINREHAELSKLEQNLGIAGTAAPVKTSFFPLFNLRKPKPQESPVVIPPLTLEIKLKINIAFLKWRMNDKNDTLKAEYLAKLQVLHPEIKSIKSLGLPDAYNSQLTGDDRALLLDLVLDEVPEKVNSEYQQYVDMLGNGKVLSEEQTYRMKMICVRLGEPPALSAAAASDTASSSSSASSSAPPSPTASPHLLAAEELHSTLTSSVKEKKEEEEVEKGNKKKNE
jgi:hypothetical protein